MLEDIKVLKKYYTNVRLVDPVRKQVINYDDAGCIIADLDNGQAQCYNLWPTGHICLNCISMQAVLENEAFVKFEYANGKVFMVTAMPIRHGERVIALELLKDVRHLDIVEKLTESLGEQKPLDIQYSIARLNELIVKDGLTQIYNRRFIDQKLPTEMIKAQVENVPLSVIMADIDNFRQVNEQYGHVVGDDALKAFSKKIGKHIRLDSGDWMARYGGEEFLVCLVNCQQDDALLVADRMRKAVEGMEILTAGQILKITASFGVYTYYNQDIDMRQLVELADKNLYAAKKSGRNSVVAG